MDLQHYLKKKKKTQFSFFIFLGIFIVNLIYCRQLFALLFLF